MQTTIKNFKTKINNIYRYKIIKDKDEISLLDTKFNQKIKLPFINPDINYCDVLYNNFTDEHYLFAKEMAVLINEYIRNIYKQSVSKITFYNIPNFEDNITFTESRKMHIYSPLNSSHYINSKQVSVVFPVLNYLVKFDYNSKYKIYNVTTRYIGTIPLLRFTFQWKNAELFKDLLNTFERLYKWGHLYIHDNVLGLHRTDIQYINLINILDNKLYLQMHYENFQDVRFGSIKLIYNALI